jgi:hypothetical protein
MLEESLNYVGDNLDNKAEILNNIEELKKIPKERLKIYYSQIMISREMCKVATGVYKGYLNKNMMSIIFEIEKMTKTEVIDRISKLDVSYFFL